MGIGASDAPTIMRENPFRSAENLLAEKLGAIRPPFLNHRMATGIALEPEARDVYCREANLEMEPACVQSARYPWLRASLDGLAKDGSRVIEIKCGRSAYWRTVASGRPPGYYYGQLQHILAITGLPAIDFVCHFPPALPICRTVLRDEPYIDLLLDTEMRFWRRIVQGRDDIALRTKPATRKAEPLCINGAYAA